MRSSGLAFRLLLVFGGGALGTLARYLLGVAIPHVSHEPPNWSVFVANLVGAFLMGIVVTAPFGSRRLDLEHWRLLLGTGVLGGFTTYSAFTVDIAGAAASVADPLYAWLIWFVLGQVVAGIALAGAGMALGLRLWQAKDAS